MRPLTVLLLLWTVVCLALRFECARAVDFGDSEALYAVYSLYPAPSFLDHPGLIGKLYGLFGKPPEAYTVHAATAVLASLFPWLVRTSLRFSLGDAPADEETKQRRADLASFVALLLAVVPVVGVGLFALTPDWPLAVCLTAGTAFALRAEHTDDRRGIHLMAAGALFALAGYAKITGFAFLLALVIGWLRSPKASQKGGAAGWIGIGLGLVPSVEMFAYEAKRGFPMLSHRIAPTLLGVAQGLGMATVGQLLYLSPIAAGLIAWFAIRFVRGSSSKAGRMPLLALLVVLPAGFLLLAAALSPQAEPHWLAPILIPLAFAAYGNPDLPADRARLESWASSRWIKVGFGLAAVCTLALHGWVLYPKAIKLVPEAYRKDDISRELFGQNVLRSALMRTASELGQDGQSPVFVGPHWTLCSRIRLALPEHRFEVGCATAERDDFDTWAPHVWDGAPVVVWVTDDRFEDVDDAEASAKQPLPASLAGYTQLSKERVRVFRGGQPSRTFVWRVLSLVPPAPKAPAAPAP